MEGEDLFYLPNTPEESLANSSPRHTASLKSLERENAQWDRPGAAQRRQSSLRRGLRGGTGGDDSDNDDGDAAPPSANIGDADTGMVLLCDLAGDSSGGEGPQDETAWLITPQDVEIEEVVHLQHQPDESRGAPSAPGDERGGPGRGDGRDDAAEPGDAASAAAANVVVPVVSRRFRFRSHGPAFKSSLNNNDGGGYAPVPGAPEGGAGAAGTGGGHGAHAIAPVTKMSRTLKLYVKCPLIPMFVFLLVPLAMTAGAVFFPPVLDLGISSFRMPDHFASVRADGFEAARRSSERDLKAATAGSARRLRRADATWADDLVDEFVRLSEASDPPADGDDDSDGDSDGDDGGIGADVITIADGVRRRHRRAGPVVSVLQDQDQNNMWERRYPIHRLHVTYFSRDGSNCLTPERVLWMRHVEQGIQAIDAYDEHCAVRSDNRTVCLPPTSLLAFLFPSDHAVNTTGKSVFDGTGSNGTVDVATGLETATQSGKVFWFVSRDFNAASRPESEFVRSTLNFGIPMAGFADHRDRYSEQTSIRKAWLQGAFRDALEGVREAAALAHPDAAADMDFAYEGMGFRDFETNEAVNHDVRLTVAALAFIVTYFLLYTRSLWLTLAAITQIVVSYPAAYFVYRVVFGFRTLSVMNVVGLMVILGIGADDAFVFIDRMNLVRHEMDMHQAARRRALEPGAPPLTKKERSREKDAETAGVIVGTMREAAKMTLVTSFTTAAAFASNAVSSLPAIRSFGVFMAVLVVINYFMLITYFPAVLSWYDRRLRFDLFRGWREKRRARRAAAAAEAAARGDMGPLKALAAPPKRPATVRFLENVWFPFVTGPGRRRGILLAGVVVTAGMGVFAAMMRPADKPPALFPQDHNIQKWENVKGSYISASSCDACNGYFFPQGCDGVLNSGALLDGCGVCQGDSSSCRVCAQDADCRAIDPGATCDAAALNGRGLCGCSNSTVFAGLNCSLPVVCRSDADCTAGGDPAAVCTGAGGPERGPGSCECSDPRRHGERCELQHACTDDTHCASGGRCSNLTCACLDPYADPLSSCAAPFGGCAGSDAACAATLGAALPLSLISIDSPPPDPTLAARYTTESVAGSVCVASAGTANNDGGMNPGNATSTPTTSTTSTTSTDEVCMFCEPGGTRGCDSVDPFAVCSGDGAQCDCGGAPGSPPGQVPHYGPRCQIPSRCEEDGACRAAGDASAMCTGYEAGVSPGSCSCTVGAFTGPLCDQVVLCGSEAACRAAGVDASATCDASGSTVRVNATTGSTYTAAGACRCDPTVAVGQLCETAVVCRADADCRTADAGATCDAAAAPEGACACSSTHNGTRCENARVCEYDSTCRASGLDATATCDVSVGQCVCTDPTLVSGALCSERQRCAEDAHCLNGGTCDVASGTCTCAAGEWRGSFCELPVDCADDTDCVSPETCVSTTCTCVGLEEDACGVCGGDGSSCPELTMRMPGDPSTFDEAAWRESVAAALGVDPEDIVVGAVSEGSVVVRFHVRSRDSSDAGSIVSSRFSSEGGDPFASEGIEVLDLGASNVDVPPDPPTVAVVGTPGTSSISVSLSRAATGSQLDITRWQASHRLHSSSSDDDWIDFHDAASSTASATGLLPGVRYSLRARGLNSAGWSLFSTTDATTTGTVAPESVGSSLSVVRVDATFAVLTWTEPNAVPEVDSYAVEIEALSFAQTIPAADVRAAGAGWNWTTPTLSAAAGDSSYTVRVRAENNVGAGDWAEIAFATLSAPPPPDLPVANDFGLTWFAGIVTLAEFALEITGLEVDIADPAADALPIGVVSLLGGGGGNATATVRGGGTVAFNTSAALVANATRGFGAATPEAQLAGLTSAKRYSVRARAGAVVGDAFSWGNWSEAATLFCGTSYGNAAPSVPQDPVYIADSTRVTVHFDVDQTAPETGPAITAYRVTAYPELDGPSPSPTDLVLLGEEVRPDGDWSAVVNPMNITSAPLEAGTAYRIIVTLRAAHADPSLRSLSSSPEEGSRSRVVTRLGPLPPAPVLEVAALSSSAVRVAVRAADPSRPVDSIEVQVLDQGGSPGETITVATTADSRMNASIASWSPGSPFSLVADGTYRFRARARYVNSAEDPIEAGAFSSEIEITMLAMNLPGEPDDPAAPLQVVAGGSVFCDFNWAAPSVGDPSPVTGYRLRRDTTGSGDFVIVYEGPDTTHRVSGLTSSSSHDFRLHAINSLGAGTGRSITCNTTATSPPDPPTVAVAARTAGSLSVDIVPVTTGDPSPLHTVEIESEAVRIAGLGGEAGPNVTRVRPAEMTGPLVLGNLPAGAGFAFRTRANSSSSEAFGAWTALDEVPTLWTVPATGPPVAPIVRSVSLDTERSFVLTVMRAPEDANPWVALDIEVTIPGGAVNIARFEFADPDRDGTSSDELDVVVDDATLVGSVTLDPGRSYDVRVRAENLREAGPYSALLERAGVTRAQDPPSLAPAVTGARRIANATSPSSSSSSSSSSMVVEVFFEPRSASELEASTFTGFEVSYRWIPHADAIVKVEVPGGSSARAFNISGGADGAVAVVQVATINTATANNGRSALSEATRLADAMFPSQALPEPIASGGLSTSSPTSCCVSVTCVSPTVNDPLPSREDPFAGAHIYYRITDPVPHVYPEITDWQNTTLVLPDILTDESPATNDVPGAPPFLAVTGTLTGLDDAATYEIACAPFNGLGARSSADALSAPYTISVSLPPAQVPAAPATVLSASSGSVDVTVRRGDRDDGSLSTVRIIAYDVELFAAATGALVQSAVGLAPATVAEAHGDAEVSTTFAGLDTDVAYEVRAVARNSLGASEATAETFATTTMPPSSAPTAAADQDRAIPEPAIVVSWAAPGPSDPSVTQVRVAVAESGTGVFGSDTDVSAGAGSVTLRNSLAAGKQYTVRVAFVNGIGTGPYTMIESAGALTMAPEAPAGVSATAVSVAPDAIVVAVSATANNTDADPVTFEAVSNDGGAVIYAGPGPNFTIPTSPSSTWSLAVTASNRRGGSAAAQLDVKSLPLAVPGVPGGLTVTSQNASHARLAWSKGLSGDQDVEDYAVELHDAADDPTASGYAPLVRGNISAPVGRNGAAVTCDAARLFCEIAWLSANTVVRGSVSGSNALGSGPRSADAWGLTRAASAPAVLSHAALSPPEPVPGPESAARSLISDATEGALVLTARLSDASPSSPITRVVVRWNGTVVVDASRVSPLLVSAGAGGNASLWDDAASPGPASSDTVRAPSAQDPQGPWTVAVPGVPRGVPVLVDVRAGNTAGLAVAASPVDDPPVPRVFLPEALPASLTLPSVVFADVDRVAVSVDVPALSDAERVVRVEAVVVSDPLVVSGRLAAVNVTGSDPALPSGPTVAEAAYLEPVGEAISLHVRTRLYNARGPGPWSDAVTFATPSRVLPVAPEWISCTGDPDVDAGSLGRTESTVTIAWRAPPLVIDAVDAGVLPPSLAVTPAASVEGGAATPSPSSPFSLRVPPPRTYTLAVFDIASATRVPQTVTPSAAGQAGSLSAFRDSAQIVTYEVSGLRAGGAYKFMVAAANDIGLGSFSAVCVGSTEAPQPPALPGAPAVEYSEETVAEVSLVFDVDASEGLQLTVTVDSPTSGRVGRFTSDLGTSAVVITGLSSAGRYTFTYAASNSAGQSSTSETIALVARIGGCDGVPGSGKIVDACGECGGSGVIDVDGNCCSFASVDCEGRCFGRLRKDRLAGCCLPEEMDCFPRCPSASIAPFTRDVDGNCCADTTDVRDSCNRCYGNDRCAEQSKAGLLNENAISVQLVWGIGGLDRGTGTVDVDDPIAGATPELDDQFDISDPDAQVHIRDTCQLASDNPDLVQQTPDPLVMTCPVHALAQWREGRGEPFPVLRNESLTDVLWAFVSTDEGRRFQPYVGFSFGSSAASDDAPSTAARRRRRRHRTRGQPSSGGGVWDYDDDNDDDGGDDNDDDDNDDDDDDDDECGGVGGGHRPGVARARRLDTIVHVLENGGGSAAVAPVGVQWVAASFLSNSPEGTAATELLPLFDAWEAFSREREGTAPASAGTPYQSSDAYPAMFSEVAAVSGLVIGIVISIVSAFLCILFFTADLTITVLCVTTMMAVVTSVIGSFFLLGWSFGPVEAISISVIVGSAVDPLVHLGEGVLEADGYATRLERVRVTLLNVGTSVIHSAITTIGASSVLLMCTVQVFVRFGSIMALNIGTSLLFAMTVFLALAASFAPEFKCTDPMRRRRSYLFVLSVVASIVVAGLWFLANYAGIRLNGPSGQPIF